MIVNQATPILDRQQRVVRVFVSSTFRDMHAERDELIKRIFPQLRKLCETRGVTWGEVDLRWGITREEAERGEVLPICLAEIQRCRPYFIGLLGERYGWVPDEISPEFVEREVWLAEHRGRSVTELEILHGVLNNPLMADHAFFYFRSPSFVDSVPAEQREVFCEIPTREATERCGAVEAEQQASERKRKLARLKEKIRAGRFPVRENYPDATALGQLVLEDFTILIEQLFPQGSEPDPLDRDAQDHEAFAQSRAGVYIGRQGYFDRLNEQARGDRLPLVLLGESGSGKSALLANWVTQYRAPETPAPQKLSLWKRLIGSTPVAQTREEEKPLVLMHFIGATPYSADWMAMLRRIMGEFKRHFSIEQEIPDQPDQLRTAFTNWLHMAAARGKVVLILDALNQLEDRDGAPDLVWLPQEIPSNIRLIVSTLPGRPLDDLKKRGWPSLEVKPLEADERRLLISKYLAQYTKALSRARAERIASAEQTTNPLYLRALLDELRVFGIHERLDERIEHYLAAQTIPELYKKILQRYEEDYERDRARLVRDALTLLWAARRGLSETELLEMLGTSEGPLPRAHWSPLYLAAEPSFVSRSGLIGFAHDYVREAVKDKYLRTAQQRKRAHLKLADYFAGQSLSTRKIDELSWQLAEAKSWQSLYELLADREFFKAAWRANKFEVKAYWARVESNSTLRMVYAYRHVFDASAEDTSHSWLIGRLLADTGHLDEALMLRGHLVERFRQAGNVENLQAGLVGQALILKERGKLGEAMRLLKEAEQICREFGYKDDLAICLGNQANIFHTQRELDEAMRLYKENEQICRESNNKAGLQVSLFGQANIFYERREFDEAMRLYKKQELICRELGDKDGLRASFANQGVTLKERGEPDEAMRLYKETERMCRDVGDKHGLAISLGNQGVILYERGQSDRAMRLYKEEERLFRELDNKILLTVSLIQQAGIFKAEGELDEAMRLYKEQEQISRELDDKNGLQRNLGNQADILYKRGRRDEAMLLYREQEQICRELGDKNGLQRSLGNEALTLRAQGELDEAMRLYKEQEQICRESNNKAGLQVSIGGQAFILVKRGELDEAMLLYKEGEQICHELGDKDGLQRCFGNQAVIFKTRGEVNEVLRLYKEQERICRELGNKDGLQRSLEGQALIFKARGELDKAMRLFEKQERICLDLGNTDGLRASFANQALIFRAQGKLDEAIRLHKEDEHICRELGDKNSLQRSLGNRAGVHKDKHEFAEAMRLYQEQEGMCRELGDKDGLAISLGNQALMIARDMRKPRRALPLAEEAYRIAADHGSVKRVEWTKSILNEIGLRAR
ncbi:MAG: DUF4062 domain-containing protein [Acidobacteriota bacterium]|nr:DUF4062 domain-containing protein [Acidobacteriota bacterium]